MSVLPFRLTLPQEVNDPLSIEFMLADLAKSGLVPEDLGAYPIASSQFTMTGAYCIPYPDGVMFRIRHNRMEDKYIQPPKTRGVWWPPKLTPEIARELQTIWIIEGEKKAAAFVKAFPKNFAFGIGGCNSALETVQGMRQRLLPDIVRGVTAGQRLNVIFDADILSKFQVQNAALSLKTACEQHHLDMHIYRPPEGKGVDDWLVANPDAKIEDLIEVKEEDLQISRKQIHKTNHISVNEEGQPVNNWSNMYLYIKNIYGGRIRNDRYFGTTLDGENIDIGALEVEVIHTIQRNHIRLANENKIRDALHCFVDAAKTNLLQELIKHTKWDGIERLETMGSLHLFGDNQKVTDEWFRILMTGLYARIMYNGTKFDIVPILIGPQGIGKTTFFEELSTFEGEMLYGSVTEFSSESDNKNVGEVDLFRQSVVVDLAEGAVFDKRKNKIDLVKHRLSQVEDTCRALYSGKAIRVKRGFIFVGTANRKDIANDSTGSRRFAFLSVTKIIKITYYEKVQLLAELHAKWRELENTPWYESRVKREDIVVPEELAHVQDVQEIINFQYVSNDDFGNDIKGLIENKRMATCIKYPDCYFVTAAWLKHCLGEMHNLNQHSISANMRKLEMSPTFPYIIEFNAKIQAHLLDYQGDKMMMGVYNANITNALKQLTGYKLTPKTKKE